MDLRVEGDFIYVSGMESNTLRIDRLVSLKGSLTNFKFLQGQLYPSFLHRKKSSQVNQIITVQPNSQTFHDHSSLQSREDKEGE